MIVRVILVGVIVVTIVVLIGHDEVLVIYVAIFVVIFCNWRCTLYTYCTVPDSHILNLYNPSKMSSDGICVIDNNIPSHLESNS